MKNPKKILIVDDDPAIRKVLRERLVSQGFQVVETDQGASTVAIAKEKHPDLILLDIIMPGRDGIQVYAALRQEPATKEVPVLFLTALSGGLEPLKDLNPGGSYWMFGKPYQPEQLMKAIEEALGESEIEIRMRRGG